PPLSNLLALQAALAIFPVVSTRLAELLLLAASVIVPALVKPAAAVSVAGKPVGQHCSKPWIRTLPAATTAPESVLACCTMRLASPVEPAPTFSSGEVIG